MLRDRYLEAMSEAAATVSVVTTDGPAGRAGVTVSAMCSVSADPPTILVCVHHLSPACEAIRENGAFCVNVLGDEQSIISDTFAGRAPAPGGDKFDCAAWRTLATGAPALDDPLVALDLPAGRAPAPGLALCLHRRGRRHRARRRRAAGLRQTRLPGPRPADRGPSRSGLGRRNPGNHPDHSQAAAPENRRQRSGPN